MIVHLEGWGVCSVCVFMSVYICVSLCACLSGTLQLHKACGTQLQLDKVCLCVLVAHNCNCTMQTCVFIGLATSPGTVDESPESFPFFPFFLFPHSFFPFFPFCSSQPSIVHWLSSSIFPCLVVWLFGCSSRYGDTRPNLTSSCPTPPNPYIF